MWFPAGGGEEFLILRGDCRLESGLNWAESVRNIINATPVVIDGIEISVSASFGIADVESSLFSEATVDQADQALYFAQKHGRNRCCTWPLVRFAKEIRSGDLDSAGHY